MRNQVELLRKQMKKFNIEAVVIFSSDFHGSEYIGDYFKAREWVSGFTGSAGTLVVTMTEAGLWTDGRYFIQAENQLQDSGITLYKSGLENVIDFPEFLLSHLKSSDIVAMDGRMVSNAMGDQLRALLQEKEIQVKTDWDPVEEIWDNRPTLSNEKAWLFDVKYCGQSRSEKFSLLRQQMKEKHADYLFVTALDEIAWLFNCRGNDVLYNPVVLAFAIISQQEVFLFCDELKFSVEERIILEKENIRFKPYTSFISHVRELNQGSAVWLDRQKVNDATVQSLAASIRIVDEPSPISLAKAIKNPVEIENLRQSHRKDGVAITKLMYWLKHQEKDVELTEWSIQQKLHELRCQQEGFIEDSFQTICAYQAHGAMMHYSASEDNHAKVDKEGLLLIDSGGQYLEGTTDITRTFAVGRISQEIKKVYTTVLQGMLNLSSQRYLYGCSGINLDILARGPIWQLSLDYQCGTGHGVGFCLHVHEGPHGIRWRKTPACSEMQCLEEGMVVTNEPGVYLENQYGIRIENELVVKKAKKNFYGQFMEFETITYAPIDLDCVDPSFLTPQAKATLNQYHQEVAQLLSPYLDEQERIWLGEITSELS